MSTLRHPPLARFVEHLRDRYGITTLVETGTFEGESTLWAAERFSVVITIDIQIDGCEQARSRCADHRNVWFQTGDTRQVLPDVVAELKRPAVFWLDAHSAPGLFGDADDWPVLEELAAINASPLGHFILIDDAHCFLPGSPHPLCPTFGEVEALAIERGYVCRVAHDVIAMVPRDHAVELDEFARPE